MGIVEQMAVSNPQLQQTVSMLKNSQNPEQMIQQLAQNDPSIANAMQIVNGKSPQEVESYIQNAIQTTGFVPQPKAVPPMANGFDKFK